MRAYREGKEVKQEVVHLGQHGNVYAALTAWEQDVLGLKATRLRKGEKLGPRLTNYGR